VQTDTKWEISTAVRESAFDSDLHKKYHSQDRMDKLKIEMISNGSTKSNSKVKGVQVPSMSGEENKSARLVYLICVHAVNMFTCSQDHTAFSSLFMLNEAQANSVSLCTSGVYKWLRNG
jgi:hypothetical protein